MCHTFSIIHTKNIPAKMKIYLLENMAGPFNLVFVSFHYDISANRVA